MKKTNSLFENVQRFVGGSGVVRGEFNLPDGRPLRIFYGETVDEYGMPIDCLKYYFFLSLLQKHLRSEATVVLADTASFLNDSAKEKQEHITRSLERRRVLLEKIIRVYRLPIRIQLMSEIFITVEYKKMREKVELNAKQVEHLLEKTVPESKVSEERKKNFRYALDAVATSLLFDIKIGPPRERFYDEVGEIINPGGLSSVYLIPTQPLGKNFAFFLTHPEIEEYGVTPYKAGSNKLQDFRIILGETPFEKAKELVETSFESDHPETVHPVKDIAIIADMARLLLAQKQERLTVTEQVRKYIYRPLEGL